MGTVEIDLASVCNVLKVLESVINEISTNGQSKHIYFHQQIRVALNTGLDYSPYQKNITDPAAEAVIN